MTNASEEVRRWEAITANAPDEYVMYAAGVDDRDSETTCYYDEESAIWHFEFFADYYRTETPGVFKAIFLFSPDGIMIRDYYFSEE